jgi:hypothetical protein
MPVVTDDFVGPVTETGSDIEMGRWSYQRLLGKQGRNIIVVSLYQVCNQQANNVRDRTAFAQHLSLLRRNGKDCSARKSFFDGIDKQIGEWIEKGYEIILSGDLNEELGSDIHGFARISARHNLVEVIQHFHGTENEPPTYACGIRRLDYIFCTPNLLSSVKRCGILPYSKIIHSVVCQLRYNHLDGRRLGKPIRNTSSNPESQGRERQRKISGSGSQIYGRSSSSAETDGKKYNFGTRQIKNRGD